MTEEQLTKNLMRWLEVGGWAILSFDFPQSGTGVSLHPNEALRSTKNKGAFIPDIVAIKSETVIFFENKDRFVLTDFLKVLELRTTKKYSESIEKLLQNFSYAAIFYGVGLAHSESARKKAVAHLEKTDFVVFSKWDHLTEVVFDPYEIFK